jgi:uncharacterized protein YndB with AHSA1/START domain
MSVQIRKDTQNKKVFVVREFNAPVADVWRAWTEASLLEQWWAPLPWKAKTKTMNFTEGGHWLYAMVGPEGEEHWAKVIYDKIEDQKYYIARDMFCDENGNPSNELPGMIWKNSFTPSSKGTKVEVEMTFKSEEDMQKIFEMGFEEGFTLALNQLSDIFEKVK